MRFLSQRTISLACKKSNDILIFNNKNAQKHIKMRPLERWRSINKIISNIFLELHDPGFRFDTLLSFDAAGGLSDYQVNFAPDLEPRAPPRVLSDTAQAGAIHKGIERGAGNHLNM